MHQNVGQLIWDTYLDVELEYLYWVEDHDRRVCISISKGFKEITSNGAVYWCNDQCDMSSSLGSSISQALLCREVAHLRDISTMKLPRGFPFSQNTCLTTAVCAAQGGEHHYLTRYIGHTPTPRPELWKDDVRVSSFVRERTKLKNSEDPEAACALILRNIRAAAESVCLQRRG